MRVARADPEKDSELARHKLAENPLWSQLVWVGDRLLVRARGELRLWSLDQPTS